MRSALLQLALGSLVICSMLDGDLMVTPPPAAEPTPSGPGTPRENAEVNDPSREVELLNSLSLGSIAEGAVTYLQLHSDRLESLATGPGWPIPKEQIKPYELFIVVRTGSKADNTWSSQAMFLYFHDGYLIGKCIAHVDQKHNAEKVFDLEIASGLQHPLNYKGLNEKIHWGKPVMPKIGKLSTPIKELKRQPAPEGMASVRCGVALEGLPPFAKRHGYNALLICQNVGGVPLNEDIICSPGGGPWTTLRLQCRDDTKTLPLGAPLGLFGSRTVHVPYEKKQLLLYVGFLRLNPGEAIFRWYRIGDFKPFSSIQAEVRFGGLTAQEARHWDAKSPEVPLSGN